MRVKIGLTWYDSKDQPLMVELNDHEKVSINHMGDLTRYCVYDGDAHSPEEIKEWMSDG